MSNSGGFAVTRTHPDSRFYNPPPIRRQQQQQQKQKQKQQKAAVADAEGDESVAFSRPSSGCSPRSNSNSSTSSSNVNLTNLDRLMESVKPSVRAQFCLPELRPRGCRTRDVDLRPYFVLKDLWESFREWSVYGVGVPLVLNGKEAVKQYYVPSLSGIQLYIDPLRPRRSGDDSDAESSRETSSAGSSDCEIERRVKGVDGAWVQHNLININSQKMNRLTLRDKLPMSSSSDEAEFSKSSGLLTFEYMEQEQPHQRKPLYDMVSNLSTQFPDLKRYRSCDLLPASWLCVAWYPIYRIPVGPTLQNLDTSFLTFHCLSTHAKSKVEPQFHATSSRKAYGVDASSKFSLPAFGLASYKLRGSILTQNGADDWQQTKSLLQAADDWLRCLQVKLPDYQFFISHSSHWR